MGNFSIKINEEATTLGEILGANPERENVLRDVVSKKFDEVMAIPKYRDSVVLAAAKLLEEVIPYCENMGEVVILSNAIIQPLKKARENNPMRSFLNKLVNG